MFTLPNSTTDISKNTRDFNPGNKTSGSFEKLIAHHCILKKCLQLYDALKKKGLGKNSLPILVIRKRINL
ncbi:hypothetical protein SuUB63_21070 [Streptococcus uberis]